MLSFLDKANTVAPSDYNRFLVPPAALCVHLCIGQAYAFSTFVIPLSHLIGGDKAAADDWTELQAGRTFSIAIVFLGLSAAVFGRWVEEGGPRRAMFTAALCFSGGFLLSAVGAWLHQLWLLYLGYGVLGGCGLGIGYISPVSTLIKWFPDRPGMATGFAIMGFGGGAMIGGPLSVNFMKIFGSWNIPLWGHSATGGVAETFLAMGAIYLVYMMIGSLIVRIPAPGWAPAGYVVPVTARALVTAANVEVNEAMKTRQFYLLWGILCLNVSAGIGVLNYAAPMIQYVFPDHVNKVIAGGFVGFLSIFNMAGRLFWSSISDYIGRRPTYMIFFLLGILLYAIVPTTGHLGSTALFVAAFAIIFTMYGGGFATIPAYLRDIFGTMHVGAIHGRLLTAWSVAGIVGPEIVGRIREHEISQGVPDADSYDLSMYIMAGLLAVGFLCNYFVSAVDSRHHFKAGASVPAPAGE
ncbi:MAG TPA: OFA family MFS transporter [Stellaceae bacterium]|nr:OFA family MFS transporter [Stellaceae bacterium]